MMDWTKQNFMISNWEIGFLGECTQFLVNLLLLAFWFKIWAECFDGWLQRLGFFSFTCWDSKLELRSNG